MNFNTSINNKSIVQINPVGLVYDGRDKIEDDFWGGSVCKIKVSSDYHHKLNELLNYQYLYFVFHMHCVADSKISISARHPRNDPSLPLMGILAQRGKNRPNKIGFSCAKNLDFSDGVLTVENLDAISGTPILNILPFNHSLEPHTTTDICEPSWLADVMKNYYKPCGSVKNYLINEPIFSDKVFNKSAKIPMNQLGTISPVKCTDSIKKISYDTNYVIDINKDILDNTATMGLNSFSHITILYADCSSHETMGEISFVHAKLSCVEDFRVYVSLANEGIDLIKEEKSILDIKPYTKLFLPSVENDYSQNNIRP